MFLAKHFPINWLPWQQEITCLLFLISEDTLNNVSVNSKPGHPPGKPPENFYERANSPPPGNKESAKPRPLGQKNRPKTPPPAQLFSKIMQRNTKHEIEIAKNSTETLTCLVILKQ